MVVGHLRMSTKRFWSKMFVQLTKFLGIVIFATGGLFPTKGRFPSCQEDLCSDLKIVVDLVFPAFLQAFSIRF
jgi:hypothetical protein